MPDSAGKFSIFEIGSNEEELAWSKRKLDEPPTYKQKKSGGDNLRQSQLQAIISALEVVIRQNRELIEKVDSLQTLPAGLSTSPAGNKPIKKVQL